MNDFQFRPSFIQLPAYHSFEGSLCLPGSKSITNRVFLISALAEGTTHLKNLLKSDDTVVRKLNIVLEDSTKLFRTDLHGTVLFELYPSMGVVADSP